MLIEFSVSNFRSFRDRQTFSMVAAPRLRKKENVISPKVKGETLPDLLKVAAVYGPNASGKSNLIKALRVFEDIVVLRQSGNKQPLPAAPFRFDPTLVNQPSCFEWHFIADSQRYCFELAITMERIVLERLTVFPQGREELLYERKWQDQREQYRFGAKLEGGEVLHQAWCDLTNSQTLFLQQAVANSKDELRQLREPWGWLENVRILGSGRIAEHAKAALRLSAVLPEVATKLAQFLQTIDVPVTSIQFDQSVLATGQKVSTAKFIHGTQLGAAEFALEDESDGTINLIGFWLSWHPFSVGTEQGIPLLVADELDSSLHPNIVATLIKQRFTHEHTRQLIFTTHDTHLMDTKLLRRDQIWLTERDANGATQLYSIHDIDGRESEDIEKRYYEGRYRGLPILREN